MIVIVCRYGVATSLVSVIALIVFGFVFGIFCGAFGYSAEDLPHERNSVACCGAKIIFM